MLTNFYHKSKTTFLPSGGFFDPIKIQSEIDKLAQIVNAPDLWEKPEYARNILQKKSGLEKQLSELNRLDNEYKNLAELYELSPEDADINKAIEQLATEAHQAKFITLFN